MKHANISLFVTHLGCPHQCTFCNQRTISGSQKSITPKEVRETLEKAVLDNNNPETTEIAFFGGSFTAIPQDYMVALLNETRPFIDGGHFCGIRLSTRPDAISQEILNILREYKVTSIELGAQSTDDEVLKLNRRGHTRQDIINASKLIKENGFSLGLQMMTGLYGDTDERALKTCEDIVYLRPDTVRIYPTITIEGTELEKLYKENKFKPQTLDEAVNLCSKLLKRFYDENITVIRLGLHSGGNVEEGYVAGPYHPAFGELCEGKIYLDLAKEEIKNKNITKKDLTIYVNPKEISKMVGQKGVNKAELLKEGYLVTVRGNSDIPKYQVMID